MFSIHIATGSTNNNNNNDDDGDDDEAEDGHHMKIRNSDATSYNNNNGSNHRNNGNIRASLSSALENESPLSHEIKTIKQEIMTSVVDGKYCCSACPQVSKSN